MFDRQYIRDMTRIYLMLYIFYEDHTSAKHRLHDASFKPIIVKLDLQLITVWYFQQRWK